ncbi:hypothetical protein CW676_08480 [Macrococcoides caseolyticum]|uniref:YopX family protein n=1 Tax=Macrococcoides caseolyticum TaxID=69966 RepID=UPI000C34D092|nr:YopX family protein [Macrococcus caseolyticus]PKE52735.1 hypothetical protein CW676_08480 [Macrococcus caseolyticus]PKF38452.1 hypothetical protein CW681_06545 [Macrococcus caseolyticus]
MIPKFRIFDKKKKRFLGDFTMEIDKFGIHVLDEFNYVVDEDDRVLMQSTGMIDENKAEVFQDDIVWHDQNEDYGVVEIDEAKFVIRWQDGYVEDLFERIDLLEVVGNIHEHPELLIQPK